jgi:hypothetical protein
MARTLQHSTSPKRLTAIQTSRHFRMSHHRHSGRVLPRTSTSYPLLTMIVLCVGVLIGGWTQIVKADTPVGSPQLQASYTVRASVPAPLPTQPATIASPADNQHFNEKPIIVSGSCPVDANGGYVSIYRNNFYSGTAICDNTGHYQLSIDLFSGANQLVARIYNFTDGAGPDSVPVTVYYDAPTPVTTPVQGSTSTKTKSATQGFSINSSPVSGSSTTAAVPLTLSTDFTIRGYYVGQQSVWQLDPEGGTAPYAIAIDWGDGSNGVVSRGTSGVTKITHTYEKPGGFHGSYIVKFTVTDAAGNQTFLQLLVVVNNRHPAAVGSTQGNNGAGFSSGVLHFLRVYIWPSYGLVLLMLVSFWLGERREFHLLRARRKRVHHA